MKVTPENIDYYISLIENEIKMHKHHFIKHSSKRLIRDGTPYVIELQKTLAKLYKKKLKYQSHPCQWIGSEPSKLGTEGSNPSRGTSFTT